MHNIRRRVSIAGFVLVLVAQLALASPSSGFNDEYVFAATKSVNDMDMNPALKVTLFPLTVVVDTIFLPFALIAGFVA